MKRKICYKLLFSILVLVLLALAMYSFETHSAAAQTGGAYDLTWNSIDGGSAIQLTGGSYSLGGTIGQPDAGMQSGGNYKLNGGFWVDFLGDRVMMPLIIR